MAEDILECFPPIYVAEKDTCDLMIFMPVPPNMLRLWVCMDFGGTGNQTQVFRHVKQALFQLRCILRLQGLPFLMTHI